MRERLRRLKKPLASRSGMTLTEVLVAMTILVIIFTVFTPLFYQYYNNVHTAGEITQTSYQKQSLMERLIANKGSNSYDLVGEGSVSYETPCAGVPIKIGIKNDTGKNIDFTAEGTQLDGTVIMSNYATTSENDYVTYVGVDAGLRLSCFPNVISDDFSRKTIFVVATGFEFSSKDNWIFNVNYTGHTNENIKGSYVDGPTLYTDLTGKKTIAKFTLYGANDYVCFENSPMTIRCNGIPLQVDITAPEIIMVGEGLNNAKNNKDDRYYYATAGVDEDGQLEIIAKKMKGDAKLNTAMNDVEWVQPEMGNNNTDVKGRQYGYYIMGGDAGEIRRFKQKSNGNYEWGGDNVVLYSKGFNVRCNGTGNASDLISPSWEGSYSSVNRTTALGSGYKDKQIKFVESYVGTSSTFFQMYHSSNNKRCFAYIYKNNGEVVPDWNAFFYVNKDTAGGLWGLTTYRFSIMTPSYATFTADTKRNERDDTKTAQVYYLTGSSSDSDSNFTIAKGTDSKVANMTYEGYKSSTGYEYANTITITSVGAVPISSEGIATATDGLISSNLYPTQSYNLYCGYIPAVVNTLSCQYNKSEMQTWTYQAALGAKVSGGVFYPTAKFGDKYAPGWNTNLNWSGNPNILATEKNDYYITSGQEVDITIGYTSHPYAISVLNPYRMADLMGKTNWFGIDSIGSDYMFTTPAGQTGKTAAAKNAGNYTLVDDKFDHSFIGSGLRDFITLLDIKSWHDDIKDKNFSIAGGYTVSLSGNDCSSWTRLAMVMNTGMVFIKGTGDGNNNDDVGSFVSGKGWSLGTESNVFHEFYSTFQYTDGYATGQSKYLMGARGWDTRYHKMFHNISTKNNKAPGPSYSAWPKGEMNGFEHGKNTHPMEYCEVSCVNKGNTAAGDTQLMWGTTNGTLLSWAYITEVNNEGTSGLFSARASNESKITSVTKEFECYKWYDKWANTGLNNYNTAFPMTLLNSNMATKEGSLVSLGSWKDAFYDFYSVKQGSGSGGDYGFVSVLDSVNAVTYGDNVWVAVGDWSGKNPSNYCGNKAYDQASNGTYINVRYVTEKSDGTFNYNWKAIKVNGGQYDIESVSFCNGYWYISGHDHYNPDSGIFMYSKNPMDGDWSVASTANVYGSSGGVQTVTLGKINSMASQEG